MKQQKEHWVKTLFSFAGPCKGKMTLSVLCAILSVAGGFVPFWAVYEILLLFINRTATLNIPDPRHLLWHFHNFGTYLRLHDTGRYPPENRKPTDESAPWRSNGTKDRLLEEYYHGQGGGFGAASGPHDPGADIEPAPSDCHFYLAAGD